MPTRRQPAKTFPTGYRSQGRSGLSCRERDRWSRYQKKDVEWVPYTGPLAEENRLDFRCAELESGEPGCRSRRRWQVLDKSQMSETETVEFVRGAGQSPSRKPVIYFLSLEPPPVSNLFAARLPCDVAWV
jgi:hypothetical protein